MQCPGNRWKSLTVEAGETCQAQRGGSQVMQSRPGMQSRLAPAQGDAFWGGSHLHLQPQGSTEEPHLHMAPAPCLTSLPVPVEQPAPVGGIPAHGREVELDGLQGPFQPKPFLDSVINSTTF